MKPKLLWYFKPCPTPQPFSSSPHQGPYCYHHYQLQLSAVPFLQWKTGTSKPLCLKCTNSASRMAQIINLCPSKKYWLMPTISASFGGLLGFCLMLNPEKLWSRLSRLTPPVSLPRSEQPHVQSCIRDPGPQLHLAFDLKENNSRHNENTASTSGPLFLSGP